MFTFANLTLPNSQEEWVISRVFQKPGSATAGGGAKKRPLSCGMITATISEVSSPPSVSMSPLLESSSAATATATAKEHVPCFSTTAAACFNFNSFFDLPPPPPPPSSMSALILDPISPSAFNEYYLSSSVISAVHGGADDGMFSYGYPMSEWPAPENQKLCTNELDCLWSC